MKIVIKKQSDTFHLNLILNIPPSRTNSFSMKAVEGEGDRDLETHTAFRVQKLKIINSKNEQNNRSSSNNN